MSGGTIGNSGRLIWHCLPALAGPLLTNEEIGQEVIRVIPNENKYGVRDFSFVPKSVEAWKNPRLQKDYFFVLEKIEGKMITIIGGVHESKFTLSDDGGWATVKRVAAFVEEKGDDIFSSFVDYPVLSDGGVALSNADRDLPFDSFARTVSLTSN